MIHEGWIDEVRGLVEAGPWPEGSPAVSGIGYEEIAAHLQGALTLHETIERTAARTRQYAKRQLTWFRAQSFEWVEVDEETAAELAARIHALWHDPS